jgi:hypothetical protein
VTIDKDRPATGGGAATSAGVRFEQQLGALLGVSLLTERPLEGRLDLGRATARWMRFETEAPVDDILIATSEGGYVAIQAKTTASLSSGATSPLGKTISQFVRYWLACRDGLGDRHWNRQMDVEKDRLVLALGPSSPRNLTEHLPSALRLRAMTSPGVLNQAQTAAYNIYADSVRDAWTAATSDPFDAAFADTLAAFIRILTFDPAGTDRKVALRDLEQVVSPRIDPEGALNALEALSATLMASRGGVDLPSVRQQLEAVGVELDAPPTFKQDIEALRRHSEAVAAALRPYELIEVTTGEPISIQRDCQPQLLEAAETGSFLIVGEPGAGKSGVLNALARDLRTQGHDVLELAVDRYSVETLEGLNQALGLEHPLPDVLEAWDGPKEGWLIIDALDATRGGRGEGVFRTLMERVIERPGRWKVIASIRTFDLRLGQRFKTLFVGLPPISSLVEVEFSTVRHVRVPGWSPNEFDQLLTKAPKLAAALDRAPPRLRELAATPFNTRLLADLIKDGVVQADLSHIASQAQLLQLYWDTRVAPFGLAGRAALKRVVDAMVDHRALRARTDEVCGADPGMIDSLEREGVLLKVDGERWVQFRHHLLFDFAAARILLDPADLVQGKTRFPKAEGRGLMLAPALAFVLREIWDSGPDRADFWRAAGHLVADEAGDPVIRSATSRLCAEYPVVEADTDTLARSIIAGDAAAAKTFVQTGGAIGVRLDDAIHTPLDPWSSLLRKVAATDAPIQGTVRFLLFKLIPLAEAKPVRQDLGVAARALLACGLSDDARSSLTPAGIDLVGKTYSTAPDASRALFQRLLAPKRLLTHGHAEAPAIARVIEHVANGDPEFARDIYKAIYGFTVTENLETNMGDSQIIPLRSSARQDYDMARYALSEYLPTFLQAHPSIASDAVVDAVEGYVAREHKIGEGRIDQTFEVGGRTVRIRDDWSHIWAHDPDKTYGHDADTLLRLLMTHLTETDEAQAVTLIDRIIARSGLAVLWSRLFLAAARRGGAPASHLAPFAMARPILLCPSTRKDAIDVIRKIYPTLPAAERSAFEAEVQTFEFVEYNSPDEARDLFLRRLFASIGNENLASEAARDRVPASSGDREAPNERLFRVWESSGSPEPYHWIQGLDRLNENNTSLMAAIDAAKAKFGIDQAGSEGSAFPSTVGVALDSLETLAATIRRGAQHADLIVYAEGVIGQALGKLLEQDLAPGEDDPDSTDRLLALFAITARSVGPELSESTEASFERGAAWSSPAPRVEAAEVGLDLILVRPNLYPRLSAQVDELLVDTHPAVRMQAALRLLRIWDIDRAGFWARLDERLERETNLSVLDFILNDVLGRTIHFDPERTETGLLRLLQRFADEPDRAARVRKSLSPLVAILWVTYARTLSREVIDHWIQNGAFYEPELDELVKRLRGAFVAGFTETRMEGDAALRTRAIDLARQITEVACIALSEHYALEEPSEVQITTARSMARLLDTVCRELYFASGAFREGHKAETPIADADLQLFLAEAEPTLKRIGDCGTPHTIYYLLQLLEHLLPQDPATVFDLMANALTQGGRRTGYQFESLGSDLLVRLVGRLLADHKELFEDDHRRAMLIACLEIFMEAGWPAARRLLYRLPDLIH